MYNFKLESVKVEDFLNRLNLRNIEKATQEEVRFSCPFPGHASGDENPSAYMNANSTAWLCHGCKRKGNAITFLSDLFNLSSHDSILFLKEYYGGGFTSPDSTLEDEINRHFMEFGKPDAEPINFTLQTTVLSDFWPDEITMMAYMDDRGFTQESLRKFQIGYDRISARIAIPIFDEVGRLVGFKGRAIDPEVKPKYKVLGGSQYGFPRYHVGLVVFGIDKVPEDARTCIIVEGELNAVAMHQMGFTNTVSPGGSTFTPIHAKKIIDRFERATLFFDSDKAGNEATARAANLLMPHMPVDVLPDHKYDPADVLQKFAPIDQKYQIESLLSERTAMLNVMVD